MGNGALPVISSVSTAISVAATVMSSASMATVTGYENGKTTTQYNH